jgi:hypothetical protein
MHRTAASTEFIKIQAGHMAKKLNCTPEEAEERLEKIIYKGLEKYFVNIKPCDGVLDFIKKLKENGYESYVVGGYVRDRLLGKKGFDIDITTITNDIFSDGGIVSVEFLFYLEKPNPSNNYSMAVNIIGGAGVVGATSLCFNDSVAPNHNSWKLRPKTFIAENTYGISTYKDFHAGNSFKIVLNGADTLSGFDNGYSGIATINTSKISCGFLSTQNSNSGIMRLFTARLYSRALTAEEIAANYAIDKVRFNLPDAT